MFKMVAAGITALCVAASPSAYAQDQTANPRGTQNAGALGEPSDVTNLRIEVLQSALQLTPSQEQYWPPIEQAIRTRAQHRLARLQNLADRASDLGNSSSPLETAINRNPVDFLQRRADTLAQRSADLKKLADAWQPLYQVLSPDQKRRLGLVRVIAFGAVMNRIRGGGDSYDDEE
jgi:LTXXQ motif family protein